MSANHRKLEVARAPMSDEDESDHVAYLVRSGLTGAHGALQNGELEDGHGLRRQERHMAGLLARYALRVSDELRLLRAWHGCKGQRPLIWSEAEKAWRRLEVGERGPQPGDRVSWGLDDICCVTPDNVDWLNPRGAGVVVYVPKRGHKHYGRRLHDLLVELLEHEAWVAHGPVPDRFDLAPFDERQDGRLWLPPAKG